MKYITFILILISCNKFDSKYKNQAYKQEVKELKSSNESDVIRYIKINSNDDKVIKYLIDKMSYSLLEKKFFRALELLIKKGLDVNESFTFHNLYSDEESTSFLINNGYNIKSMFLKLPEEYLDDIRTNREEPSGLDLEMFTNENNKNFIKKIDFFTDKGCTVNDLDKRCTLGDVYKNGNNFFLNMICIDPCNLYKVHQKKERAILEKKYKELLEFLLEKGFDINFKNSRINRSAFETAASRDSLLAVKFLLSKKEHKDENILSFILSQKLDSKVYMMNRHEIRLTALNSVRDKYKKMNPAKCTVNSFILAIKDLNQVYDFKNKTLRLAHQEVKEAIFMYILSVYKCGFINDKSKLLMQKLYRENDILSHLFKHI